MRSRSSGLSVDIDARNIAASEEKAVHLEGIEMSVWNVLVPEILLYWCSLCGCHSDLLSVAADVDDCRCTQSFVAKGVDGW
jgi:hypothetical protein